MNSTKTQPIRSAIEARLQNAFPTAQHIEVINESSSHAVPPGSETHFKVVVVCEQFAAMKRLERHRAVQEAVGADLQSAIKALSVRTVLPHEWNGESALTPSPGCHGGH